MFALKVFHCCDTLPICPFITEFHQRVSATAKQFVDEDYEIVLVNDGSRWYIPKFIWLEVFSLPNFSMSCKESIEPGKNQVESKFGEVEYQA